MIGIFDSGVGGMCAYYELKRLLPREDFIYLADTKNAPYGTKTKEELIQLVKKDVAILRSMGADRILIACCTASSVHYALTASERKIAIPIILPAAKVAASHSRVAVIATEHTVRQSAFGNAIKKLNNSTVVLERAEQALVAMVEGGCRDGNITRECYKRLCDVADWVNIASANALILGCTHFSHLEKTLQTILPEVKIISPAKEGAKELSKLSEYANGSGRIIYTDGTAVSQGRK